MQSYHLYVGQLESLIFSFFLEHVYVQIVVIVDHILPWFYVQEGLKRSLWVGDKLRIQFFKKLTNMVFLVRLPRLSRSCSL